MLVNYHVHSEFSFDSIYDMEQIVIDAINNNIVELCFTDHVDYGVCIEFDAPRNQALKIGDTVFINVDYPNYIKKIEYLQNKYQDKITIRKGFEFGVQTTTLKEYETLYNRYPLDFVILSNHQIDNVDIALPEYFENKSQRQAHRLYYEKLLEVMKVYKHYCVLGHLDYPLRYDPNGKCPYEEYEDLVIEILKQAIVDNKGIELNMACLRYPQVQDLTPSRQILKKYLELGGKIITIGTDSHKPEQLFNGLELGMKQLKELGYKEYCTFKNMEPIFHKL